jgi:hypothetical protein
VYSAGVAENGTEARVRRGGVCRVGQESGAGGVEVSSVGTCRVQVHVGVAVPTAGAGAAKRVISGRQETGEMLRYEGPVARSIDEGLGVCGVVAAGVGVEGRAEAIFPGISYIMLARQRNLYPIKQI